MGFLQNMVQGGLNAFDKYDPVNSALFNGMIDVDTTSVRETMNSSEHFWDDEQKRVPGFAKGFAGDMKDHSQHWSEMAQKDNDNHARAITNAGLTLAALYGGYYGYNNPDTLGGAFGEGYAGGSAASAAAGGSQDDIAKGGLIGGTANMAGQFVGDETHSKYLGGAARGATSAGFNGTSVGRGALTGGLSEGTPDVGSSLGVQDQDLNKAITGGLKGGIMAKANGGNVGASALQGALPGLTGYGVNQMDSNEYGSGYDPIKSATGGYSSAAPWASSLAGSSPSTPTPWSSTGGGYSPTTEGVGTGNPVKDMFRQGLDTGRDIMNGISDYTGINRGNFGNVVEGLAGLYQGWQQRKQARDLQTMMGMRRQAYQDQLRKNLIARDAAAGKRSDYGGRETQLMSSLADLDARNAPAMMNLSNMQLGGGLGMLQSGLRLGGKMGWLGTGNQPNMNPMPMPNYTPMSLSQLYQPQNTLNTSYDPNNWDRVRRPDQFGQ